jgi:ferrochelatase
MAGAKKMKKGILLSNLGSPSAPTPEALKVYLDQFLMDRYVIDLPYPLRALLVRGIIMRTRPKKSAHAYEVIWTPEGAPLVVTTDKLTQKVQQALGSEYSVKFAMRYGQPSFQDVLNEFKNEGISEVSLLPLYPQWAYASTGSTEAHIKELNHSVKISKQLDPYPDDSDFIGLWLKRFQECKIPNDSLKTHYVFSFHGIPERHIKKRTASCETCRFDKSCCLAATAPKFCYRSQCEKTALAIARSMGLSESQYTVTFQSRLGLDPWLKPYTDKVIVELPKQGVERLVMFSPAFTADCLETIEELGVRAKEDFEEAGGKEFTLVPSLNEGDDWAALLAQWVREDKHFAKPNWL